MKALILTTLILTLGLSPAYGQSAKKPRKNKKLPAKTTSSATYCYYPNVIDLVLTEVSGGYEVKSIVENKYNSPIKYLYFVTTGKIVGEGHHVRWEIGDALPGIYTITSGVDDGCPFCGQTRTVTITVK
ncbi:MAG: hypothetical protein JNL64_03755 [Blastocatellia bacterium]|nr:hypothetical protein [Blastocatellia bacterium]